MKNQIIKEILEDFDKQFDELYDPEMQEGDLINFLDSSAQPLTHRVKSFIESALERMSKETLDSVRMKIKYENENIPFIDGYNACVSDLENNIKKFNDD
jgi:hypothetical protein